MDYILDRCLYRVDGPIFFANADSFVDQLYSDVLRPTDIKQPAVVSCIVVSDDRQEFFVGDSSSPRLAATSQNGVEMSELHCTNGAAAAEHGDAQATDVKCVLSNFIHRRVIERKNKQINNRGPIQYTIGL